MAIDPTWIAAGGALVSAAAALLAFRQSRQAHHAAERKLDARFRVWQMPAISPISRTHLVFRLMNEGANNAAAVRVTFDSVDPKGLLVGRGVLANLVKPGEYVDVEVRTLGLANEPPFQEVGTIHWISASNRDSTQDLDLSKVEHTNPPREPHSTPATFTWWDDQASRPDVRFGIDPD